MIEEQQKQEIVKALRIFISMVKDIAQGGESKRKGIMKFFHNKAVVKGNSFGISEVEIREIIDAQTNKLKELIKGEGGIQSSIDQLPDKVVEVIKTSFEKELSKIGATYTKTADIQTALNDFFNNKIPGFMQGIEEKIGDRFDAIIKALEDGKKIQEQLAAGQEAQGKDLKALREKQEKQDEINRRLDLYMTSTKAAIAKNMEQLNNIEKMLLLKEEKDRKDFDAVKKGLEGLEKNDKEIKEKIGGLLKEETAFQEFQKLWDHNNYIKQQNDDIKQQNDYIKTLLTELADNVYKQDEGEKNKIKSVIDSLEDKLTTLNDSIKNAIAASDAKLLGMIMPEFAAIEKKLDEQKQGQDSLLQGQAIQTTILNSILSGQQDNALQYVAMSEKLDNLTELVIALGIKTKEQSFTDDEKTQVVNLLENFAKSQKAAFATVAKKEDLKRIDTGIDSIINMLSDNSITLKMMNESIKSMVSQINVMAIDIKRVLEILSQTRTKLGVADCDRCHSAKSRFYKCQICGYDGREIDPTTEKQAFPLYQSGKKLLIAITDTDMCNKQTDNKQTDDEQAGNEQTGNYIFYISHLSQHRFADNETVDASKVEKIVFDICRNCKNSCCDGCKKQMTIKLISSTDTTHEGENNIWRYFENLKAISFAKTKDGAAKYILGSGLLCEDNSLSKIRCTTFYGGSYLGTPEQGICNIGDNSVVTEILDRIDPTENFHKRVSGDTWRTPHND